MAGMGLGPGYHRVKIHGKTVEFGIIWATIWDPRSATHEMRGHVRADPPAPPAPVYDMGPFTRSLLSSEAA